MPKVDYGQLFVDLASKRIEDVKIIAKRRAEAKYPNNEKKQNDFYETLLKTYLLHTALLKQENSRLPGVDALFEEMDEYYFDEIPYWYLCVAMSNGNQMSHPAAVMYDGKKVVILIAKATSSSMFRGLFGLASSIRNSKNRNVEVITMSTSDYKGKVISTGGTLGSKVETLYLNWNWSLLTDAARVFHNDLIEIIDGNTKKAFNTGKTSSSLTSDKVEELKRYKELLDSGIITQEEFDQKKKELLV